MISFSKKERPVCKHCEITGHVNDKYNKLHGFLLGYKPKQKPKSMAN